MLQYSALLKMAKFNDQYKFVIEKPIFRLNVQTWTRLMYVCADWLEVTYIWGIKSSYSVTATDSNIPRGFFQSIPIKQILNFDTEIGILRAIIAIRTLFIRRKLLTENEMLQQKKGAVINNGIMTQKTVYL